MTAEMAIPSTRQRVRSSTAQTINERIDDEIDRKTRYYSRHPGEIDQRLHELDGEWDVERMIEANAATIALAGTVLGVSADKRFLAVPALVAAFLLQHAVQGWCPPVPILRRLGYRTLDEINRERYALKAMRGDFAGVGQMPSADAALAAVRAS